MMKTTYKKIIFIIISTLVIIYGCFLFVLPKLLSSKLFKDIVDDYIYEKTEIEIVSEQLKIKTFPNLTIEAKADLLEIDNAETDLLKAKNTEILFDLKTLSLKGIDIDYIYVDEEGFKSVLKKKSSSKKSKINLQKLPAINVNKCEIWIDKGEKNSVYINIDNLKQTKEKNKTVYTFEAEIISDLLKNLITLGTNGSIYYENNALYADNFQAIIGTSELNINGRIIDNKRKNTDLSVTGRGIPIEDIMSSILYFQQMKEPGKKFIENFYNYSGKMNVDLKVNNNGISGRCRADKLAGNTVLFDIPVIFPTVDFIFDKKTMTAGAYGLFGGEKVYSDVKITDIGSPNQDVFGTVRSVLTDKFADKYVPDFTIKGSAKASVVYHIKNKIINVDYKLKIPKESDIYFKTAYLGLEDKERRLFVNTVKAGDKLTITNYDYSTKEDGKRNKIILGDGLYLKEDGHLKPQYLTFKTQKDAPVSVTGSFHKYLEGGVFNGDLKYDFKNNKITGIFNIKDSKYKNFKISAADIEADDKIVQISANGTYNNSKFNCKINGANNFNKQIKIYNMNLFLDEYIVKNKQNANASKTIKNAKKIADKVKKIDVDVDKWTIKVNRIVKNRLILRDINVNGDIHNSIFRFTVPKLDFAKGIIIANGHYNYNKRSSEVNIEARNIDSATVADVLFELPNQIEGTANAKIQGITKNGIDDILANISFTVDKGFLPQLGSTEFMIKKSKMIRKPLKFKLQDAVNIDLKNMQALSSDLKGNFIYDNNFIKNAHITSSQKFLALLIEGDYNIDSEQADFNILGKYNKNQISKIKIFFVPLSLILKTFLHPEKSLDKYRTKLQEVPDIQGDEEDECAFRVKLKGNLNKNDVKVEMKRIK